jgi:ppGpp synthetase/RelA/SpoT-type nucleotidyltranferase
MAWAIPDYSKNTVNRAGQALIDPDPNDIDSLSQAQRVFNNWRSSHSFPLNTIQNGVRRHAISVYPSALVAQRLKRSPSIINKLRIYPSMNLAQMQDIGGCRVVVRNIAEVFRTGSNYIHSDIRHELFKVDNYITNPKSSGYRSLHIIIKYKSDKNTVYDNLLIEIQIRTIMQHAWATAVEIIDFIKGSSLKSSHGPDKWRRFFKYMGSVFAIVERTPKVPYTPRDQSQLVRATKALAYELEVRDNLKYYADAFQIAGTTGTNHAYFLLILNTSSRILTILGYHKNEFLKANEDYLIHENNCSGDPTRDVVLVAANALSRAYPNYFMNSRVFIERMEAAFSSLNNI